MSPSAQLIAAVVSAIFSVLLTAIVGYIAWRGRNIFTEIDKNSKFRRYMVGQENFERDDGELDEIDAQFRRMRAEQSREHREVRDRLEEIEEGMGYITEFVRRIGRAINRSELDHIIEEPDHSVPDRWEESGDNSD